MSTLSESLENEPLPQDSLALAWTAPRVSVSGSRPDSPALPTRGLYPQLRGLSLAEVGACAVLTDIKEEKEALSHEDQTPRSTGLRLRTGLETPWPLRAAVTRAEGRSQCSRSS